MLPRSSSVRSTSSPRPGRYLWLSVLAALFSGLIYINALDNPFVYDDHRTVLQNRSIDDVWAVRTIVYREMTRPVVNYSYAVDRAIWGEGVFGFHLTSILLHVVNVLLLFQFARRVVEDQQARRAAPISPRISPPLVAFCTAAIFGLHPLMTEAVGYISGRSEVLCGTLFLGALLAMRRWMRGDGRTWLVGGFGMWVAALLTKEIAAMWPLVLLAYDRLVVRDDPARARRRWWRVLAPMMGLTLLAGLVRLAVLLLVENPDATGVIWRYALVEIEVAFRYFALLLSPSQLSVFHQVDEVFWPPAFLLVASVVWLLVWVFGAVRVRRLDGAITLGMLWFLLLLVPSAVLVMLNLGEPMAEHRVYLAAMGFFLAGGTAIGHLWALLNLRGARSRLVLRVALAAWLTVLGAVTVLRNEIWSDPVRLWLDAAEKAPDIWVPHVMLGSALQDQGAREEALAAYRRAIAVRSTEQAPYMKLGLCLAEMGRLGEAREAFVTLLRLAPTSAVGHNGLGAVAVLDGRHEEARRHYEEALTHNPRDVTARQSLAMLYEQVWQNRAEALRLCHEVRSLAPDTPEVDACIERNSHPAAGVPH